MHVTQELLAPGCNLTGRRYPVAWPRFDVARRVDLPTEDVVDALSDLIRRDTNAVITVPALSTLRLKDPLILIASWPTPTWRTDGLLLGRSGTRRRSMRVELLVEGWTPDATSLSLWPIAPRPDRWSTRRQNRYYTLLHAAADQLQRMLSIGATPPPVMTIVGTRQRHDGTIR